MKSPQAKPSPCLKWRAIQRENFREIEDLGAFLNLDLSYVSPFPLNLPRRLAEKIEKNNLKDPILRQFLPSNEEETAPPFFSEDPLCDQSFQKAPRLLQKYRGRTLLIATGACAMHCRYCFRQNYPYLPSHSFSEELEALRTNPTIHEVILSGGDPLSLSDERLKSLVTSLDQIPLLKILRFHTRFPIGIPERITPSFLDILKTTRLQVVFVVHVNHPRELDVDILTALKRIGMLGTPLLSQSVLLAGVNDCAKTLETLFLHLATNGILPYYLHQLDPIKQGHHFEVPIEQGRRILETLRQNLPGYAVPKYVQEIPFEKSKIEAFSSNRIESF